MARRRRHRRHKPLIIGGAARGGARASYERAKREYHTLGNALYRANHHGRSAHRKRRTKHRRSR